MNNSDRLRVERTYTLTKRRKIRTPTFDHCSEPIGVRYHWENESAEYLVIAEFNVDAIIQELADKAVMSKRGRATARRGDIVVKVTPK